MDSELIVNLHSAYDKAIDLDYHLADIINRGTHVIEYNIGHTNLPDFQQALEYAMYQASCHLTEAMNNIAINSEESNENDILNWNCSVDLYWLNGMLSHANKCLSASIYGKMVYNA